MDFIIDFYKNLDALDMFIFWGVIIVIGLLLVFSIILVNKNNKLTKIVNERGKSNEKEDYFDIPIYQTESNNKINQYDNINNTIFNNKNHSNEELFKMRDERLLDDLPDLPIDRFQNVDVFNPSNVDHVSQRSIEKKEKVNDNIFNIGSTYNDVEKTNEKQFNVKNTYTTQFKEMDKEIGNYTEKFQETNKDYDKKNYEQNNSSQFKSDNNVTDDNERETFRAEELIPEYGFGKQSMKDNNRKSNVQKDLYQKNVLKEMSFSQTSPINITSKDKMNEDLTLTTNKDEKIMKLSTSEIKTKANETKNKIIESKDIQNKDSSNKIRDEYIKKEIERYKQEIIKREQELKKNESIINEEKNMEKSLENQSTENFEDNSSDKYYDDGIDRTTYEIEQEENAIISYKELMEKKDTIQTIDEEEAVISIEELMNRSKNKNDMYGLTDESENNDFISELKKFRKEL